MNSLGTSTYIPTERENKDFNYQNQESNQAQQHLIDSTLYNRDQDVFSLSQLKHIPPSSNIYGMTEPSPITNSSNSSGTFNGEEMKPLLSDYKQDIEKSSIEYPSTSLIEKVTEIKDDKGETSQLNSSPMIEKIDDTPARISSDYDSITQPKDYGTISSSTNTSSITNPIIETPSDSQQVVPTEEGAVKSLKQVGHIIQSQAQTVADSIRNNVNSDNIVKIIIDSFLVLVIAVLLYFGIW